MEARYVPINIEDEIRKSYLEYALSVIIGRALPDVQDGLKPVLGAFLTPWGGWERLQPPLPEKRRMSGSQLKLFNMARYVPIN